MRLVNFQNVRTLRFVVYFLGPFSLATKWKPCPSFPAVDLSEPTFCHAPRVLATSDLLAVHLDYHVAADYCQWHLLLEWKDKRLFFLYCSYGSFWKDCCLLLFERLLFHILLVTVSFQLIACIWDYLLLNLTAVMMANI